MILTTTGTQSTVTIVDLKWIDNNDLTLNHPQTIDLNQYYDDVDLSNATVAASIQAHIDSGAVTAENSFTNAPITSVDETYTSNPNIQPNTSYLSSSGRFYMYSDSRWVTDSDDQYGFNYYQFVENGGTNANTPVIEWEHMGMLVKKGCKVKQMKFVCRTNSTQITDVKMHIVCRRPNPITRWQSGMDNDGEDTVDVLFNGNFVESGMSGNMADRRMKTIDLGDYVVTEDSELMIYLKPIRSGGSTRYLYATYTWEIQ